MFCVGNALMAKWIPIHERSRACTLSTLGIMSEQKGFGERDTYIIGKFQRLGSHKKSNFEAKPNSRLIRGCPEMTSSGLTK